MKALTISQPFASLIARGEKWIENRRWGTIHRGDLAIHAGKGLQYLDKEELSKYPSGGVIAIARLTACVQFSEIASMARGAKRKHLIQGTNRTWSEANRHRHAEGPWCWILEDVKPCDFVAIRGERGLWEFDPSPSEWVRCCGCSEDYMADDVFKCSCGRNSCYECLEEVICECSGKEILICKECGECGKK